MSPEYTKILKKMRDFMLFCSPPGDLLLPEESISDWMLASNLGIHWFPASNTFPQGAYVCSENAGYELLRLAWKDADDSAWRLARKVLGHRLAVKEEIPDGLRTFAALVFADQIVPPKATRKNKTFNRRFLIFFLCIFGKKLVTEMSAESWIRMTKSAERKECVNEPECVCEAVSTVLNEWKIPTSYRAVQQIWNDPSERDLETRNEFEKYMATLVDNNKRDPIGFLASSTAWLHPDDLSKPGFPLTPDVTELKK